MDRRGEKRIARRNLRDTKQLIIHAVENGMHPEDAAVVFGAKRSTVYNWLKEYREKGPAAFVVGKAHGRKPLLTPRQEVELRSLIIGKDPRQLELDFALWTRELVAEVMRRRFKVSMTPQGVGKLLHRLGLSPQRPLIRAYEQDPELVARWKEEEYPAIRAAAKAAGGSILFCDEAGIRTDYHSGTTWSPVGQTPIVRGTGKRESVNMISAISPRGKLHFSFIDGNANAANFVDYLTKLMQDIPEPIFLIVDGHSSHTAKMTRDFVQSTEGRLNLFFLPPYSPELNPDEWVWKNIKHDWVGKIAARTLDEMTKGIQKAVRRLQDEKQILLGFFRDSDLSYIECDIQ